MPADDTPANRISMSALFTDRAKTTAVIFTICDVSGVNYKIRVDNVPILFDADNPNNIRSAFRHLDPGQIQACKLPNGKSMTGCFFFDPTVFQLVRPKTPAEARIGSLDRIVFTGSGTANVDLGLCREFRAKERRRIEVRNASSRELLGHGYQPELRGGRVGNPPLEVGGAVTFVEQDPAVSHNSCRAHELFRRGIALHNRVGPALNQSVKFRGAGQRPRVQVSVGRIVIAGDPAILVSWFRMLVHSTAMGGAMISRREILRVLGAVPAAGLLGPGRMYAAAATYYPKRLLGRTGRQVVPLSLGGQASLQWTRSGIDAPDIIVRAVQLGVNYLDTANAYGPSQVNYGEAFRRLHLTPGDPGYDQALRQRLFVASKTGRRYALNPAVSGATAIEDLKRSLTQIFGDGKGMIPDGAYLDSIQIHNLTTLEQVDQIYEGFAGRASRRPERIGALAALLDYRDGTNYTGLNPEHRQYIRHIGITGHQSSRVLMAALRRDSENIIDTLLVALNANDRLCCSHQNNVLPLAVSKGLGVIAMKIFADGAFYGKEPRFSRTPEDVIYSVGKTDAVSYSDLVRYPLSLPGVSCAIIGTGQIHREKPEADQMVANLTAAVGDMPSEMERRRIEKEAETRHTAATNYFQEKTTLIQPSAVSTRRDGERVVVQWNTAIAGAEPIRSYEILAGDRLLLSLPYRPQLTETPLSASLPASSVGDAAVRVVASEAAPRRPAGG